MSANVPRNKRKRGVTRDASVDASRTKKNRTVETRQTDQQNDLGFQMIGNKLDVIFKRLATLEQERENASLTASSVTSTGSIPSGIQTDQILMPQTIEIIQGSASVTQPINSGSNPGNTYIMRPAVDKPIFSGKNDSNPMKFLKKLKRYINSCNGQHRAVDIATECLTGSALKLLEIYCDGWTSLADFESDFQRVFWGETQQERAKYRLVNSTWDPKAQTSMSEHFAGQIDTVRFLTIPLTESYMVNSVIRHFPVEIQRLWSILKENKTILSAAEFLRDMEQDVTVQTSEPIKYSNQGNERGGRGHYRRMNAINMTSAQRGQGSYRGRGQRRGRNYYANNQNRHLPAIKWERQTGTPFSASNNQGNKSNESVISSAGALSQGNESVSSEAASTVRQ